MHGLPQDKEVVVKVPWHRALEPEVQPPGLRPTWTTWMWMGFAVAVLVATVVGLLMSAVPYTLP